MGSAQDSLLVGLDVGTSKIALVAVERGPDGTLTYAGSTLAPSAGMRNGTVVNVTEATAAIQAAVYDLEDWCQRRITRAVVSVGGTHLIGENLRGAVGVTPAGREVKREDVHRAIAAARGELPARDNYDILHEIPCAYSLDGQAGVQNPLGMEALSLAVEVHYASAASTTTHNLEKCVRLAGVDAELLVAAPIATGEAMRTAFEGARSLCVVDIGAETTKVVIYVDGAIWRNEVLPVGGADITNAVSSHFKLPMNVAEELKVREGHCDAEAIDEFDLVDMPEVAGMDAMLPRREVANVIQRRVYGFADALCPALDDARYVGVDPELLVVTGGGADLAGLEEVLTEALEIPVARGTNSGIVGLPPGLERPAFATVVGLIHWYARNMPGVGVTAVRRTGPLGQMATRLRRIFSVMLP
jgi:cell division protein FtsA